MKILLVSDAPTVHTRRWVEAWVARGIETHVASFRPYAFAGATTHLLRTAGLGKLGYFLGIPQLRRLLQRLRPDVVHVQHVTSYGFIAAMASQQPFMLTAWGSDILITPNESPILGRLVRYALRRAAIVTVVAEHMRLVALELGARADTLAVIPFGVNLEVFRFAPRVASPGQPLRIVCTRNMTPIYDVKSVVEAVHRLRQDWPSLQLRLAGDGPLRGELEGQVRSLGLDTAVRFLGRISHAQMAAELAEADLFVSPALSDGNNISLNEAMACGCYPVATRIVANEAWVTDGENGMLYQPGDASALAEALARAIAVRNVWPETARRNRAIVEARANWGECLDRTMELYRQLQSPAVGRA
jgi:L-malate glycosyltransferase